MSVNLSLVNYTPTDPSAAQDVLQKGDIGTIQNRVLDGNTLTITTEKGKFVFNAPGLEDPQNVTPQDMVDALASLNKLSTEGTSILADVYTIMALFQQLASTERSSAREARFAARDAQMGELAAQVTKLKEAAMMAMAMGIVSGALQVVGGAIQIGAAGSAASSLKSGTQLAKTAATSAEKATADSVLKSVDISLARGQGWSGVFSGLGGISNAIGQGVSGDMNADATADQAQATKFDAAAQEEQDFMNSMRDLIHDVQDKLQAIIQSENETQKQILRARREEASTPKPNAIQRDWEVPPTLRALDRERANVGGLFLEPLEHASPASNSPELPEPRSPATIDEPIDPEAQRYPAGLGSPAYFARPRSRTRQRRRPLPRAAGTRIAASNSPELPEAPDDAPQLSRPPNKHSYSPPPPHWAELWNA